MKSIEGRAAFFAPLASVVLITASHLALAQTAPVRQAEASAASANDLAEVVVTAQFRKERVQDTPLAITALNSAALEQKGVTDLASAANLAPNVALTRGSAVGPFQQMASVFIRGVGQADPHFAVEPGVGIYVDDVYYGVAPGAIFQLLDTDRIEVSRGPQGTLSGKNSIGGSIKMYSVAPGPDPNGYAELTYGRFDRVGGRAAGNLTLIDDKLFVRLSAAATHSDGYVDRLDYGCVTGTAPTSRVGKSCVLGTQGGQQTVTGRASLRWLPTEHVENTLSADIIQDNSENTPTKQLLTSPLWAGSANYITCTECYTNYDNLVSRPISGPSAGSPFTLPSTTPLHGWGASNNFHVEITDNLGFDSITAERQSITTFSAPAEATPASLADQVWRLAHKQFTQEFRLSGRVQQLLDWTAGVYYYRASGSSGGRVNIPFGLSPGGGDGGLGIADDILFDDPVHTKSRSVFAHTTWHPFERLGITADARYTKDSKDFIFNRWDALGHPNPAIPGLQNYPVSFSGDRFDYRAGADYKWTETFMTYVQLSTGYKGGGVNPRPFFTTQATTYSPETLTAYEVGMKSQLFERHLTLNLAGFYDKYHDFQGTLTTCNAFSPFPGAPCDMTANVGNAHISGVELESQLRLFNALSVDLSAGWLDFRYTDVNPASGVRLTDKNVFTPDLTANAGIQYAFDLGTRGSIVPRIDYSYRSDMYVNFVNDPTNHVASLGLVNARLTWENSNHNWQAALSVTNLLDKFYYEAIFDVDAPPPAFQIYGTIMGRVGRPRETLFTIRRTFGGSK